MNDRLVGTEPLPMNRFRPNIVVDGCLPFEEDGWKTLQLTGGNFKLHVVKPCARCVITCTDQRTSKVSQEPLKTLS
ncbi:MOSC domain-containing protein, partial [Acinetobacter baumannii]